VALVAAAGAVISLGAGLVQRHVPWFTVAWGLVVAGLGCWLLAGRDLPGVARWRVRGPAVRRSAVSMVAFGAAYALASLGCTVGPFLAVVVASFRAGSAVEGAALFVAYAVGMGLVVGVAAVAVALARASALGRVRRLGPVLQRVAGAVLVLGGGYVAYYGWYELRVFAGGGTGDPVVAAAESAQRVLAGAVERVGPAGFGLVLLALAGAGAVLMVRARRRAGR
jgi:cytochrome c biogenesis protein CcdA